MKNTSAVLFAILCNTACTTSPQVTSVPIPDDPDACPPGVAVCDPGHHHPPDPTRARQISDLHVTCSANWGRSCGVVNGGEISAGLEPVIPPNYSICRVVGSVASMSSSSAGSWWALDGNRVRFYSGACGGTIVDQTRAWVDVTWATYIVGTSWVNEPRNQCSPETKGIVGIQPVVCANSP
jgi:hypothetical protein